ncbi:hypothetical protein Rsub_07718 [Raphidocelis subcapitata]|uniref:Uncharacterized protein n=1 Tax=Raphidocelis subcapitata TaxID=307507 RepID=A0A2V0P5I5_9CHLO|nr:hypothetical protein Rsub_07718 [Raphidocelis subcapitata]|eukprot:GBF95134.1 hypothetical protein Rsub_07718 [Raphidocelis subcapitata]
MVMRQLNRTVVRRVARRATIGIPLLGLFFVTRLLRRDAKSLAAAAAARDAPLAALLSLAVAAECTDVVAQAINIAGHGLSSGLIPAPPPWLIGPPAAAAAAAAERLAIAPPELSALLALADGTSLACAAVACAAGLAAEAVSARRQIAGGGGGVDGVPASAQYRGGGNGACEAAATPSGAPQE